MSFGPGPVLVAPPAGRPGSHIRSTRTTGPTDDRRLAERPARRQRVWDQRRGRYWFGRIPLDPTAPGACLDCARALTVAA